MTSGVTTHADKSLNRRIGAGLGWSLVNTAMVRIGSLAVGIVLARILTPTDYGVYAVALVVLTAMLSMNELGVSLAIVRWPGDVSHIAPTVASLAAASSAVLCALAISMAPALAAFMGAPSATGVIRVLAVCVLLDAIAAVPAAMITRQFMQGRRAILDLVSFAVGSLLSIVMAIAGYGVWSLAWGFLCSSFLASSLAFMLAPRRFGYGWSMAVARQLLTFGAPLALSSGLMFLILNVDYIIVGWLLGARELGYYLLAFNICSWPVNLISATIRRVSLAGFSRMAESEARAYPGFTPSLRAVLAVTLPFCVPLSVLAGPLVGFVYGEKWLPAAPTLVFLALLAIGRVLTELCYDFLVATSRAGVNLALQAVWAALLVPVLIFGARSTGTTGVAAGHAAVALLVMAPLYVTVICRHRLPLSATVLALVRPTIAALLMAGVSYLLLRAVEDGAASLIVPAVGGAAAYLMVCWPLLQQSVRSMRAPAVGA